MKIDRSIEEELSHRTYIAFILDSSGSMEYVLPQTIDGYNQQVHRIKAEADNNTLVSLVTFNETIKPYYFNRPINKLELLHSGNYRPHGWTALYDAIGYTINRLGNEAEFIYDPAFLVLIISDGEENRSTSYNQASIANLIQNKQHTNRWTFTYVGSNQDLTVVRNILRIPQNNIFNWQYSPIGTSQAFNSVSTGLSNYMSSRSDGNTTSDTFFPSTFLDF